MRHGSAHTCTIIVGGALLALTGCTSDRTAPQIKETPAASQMGPGQGRGMGPGQGRGMGPGQGRGMGPGRGRGMGPGQGRGAGCQQNFNQMDADRDGKVTREEFSALPHRRADPAAVFDARDTDRDGALTLDEFCAGAGRGL